MSKEGLYKITKLVLDCNHEFVYPEQRHMQRSLRNLSNAGMSYKYLESYPCDEVGGFNNLGINLKDMHNYIYTEKLKSIEAMMLKL
jgi:hypothetical protein